MKYQQGTNPVSYTHLDVYKRQGLKAGDILMEIDGKDLAGKNNQEVSEMLRGQVGTSFKLKVQRPGTEQPLEFDIVRRSIQLPFIRCV